jgi:putative ABC transport system permease protein
MNGLLLDLRLAFRVLLKNPAFMLAATLTLGVGIGANAAIFSFVSSLLLRPLPFPDQDRLVNVREKGRVQSFLAAPGDYKEWAAPNGVLTELAAYGYRDLTISTGAGEQDSTAVLGAGVSANFFRTLGVTPLLGRVFAPSEDQAGSDDVAILSHALWAGRFGADDRVLGRQVSLGDRTVTIVGVMRADFDFPLGGVDLWVPLALTAAQLNDHRGHSLMTVGRMKPDVSLAKADAYFRTLGAQMELTHPGTNAGRGVTVVPLREQSGEYTTPFLLVLQAAAGFVMMIAFANVAGLQLARAVARRKEIALRIALGGKRWAVARVVLVESALVSATGSALGIAFALAGVRILKTGLPQQLARYVLGWDRISLDWPVLVFTLVSSALAGLLFGSLAAFHSFGPNVIDALRDGDQSGQNVQRHYLRKVLVTAEIALTLVMVVAAGQMVKGFDALIGNNRGFDPERVLTLHVGLPQHAYDWQETGAVYDRLADTLAALPAVETASAVSNLPGGTRPNQVAEIRFEGRPEPAENDFPVAEVQVVTPGYFQTLKIPLRRGRYLERQDGVDSSLTAMIAEGLARKYWPGEDPVGKRLRLIEPGGVRWRKVVGVAADVRQNWFDATSRPMIYVPVSQYPRRWMYLALRGPADLHALTLAARAELRRFDPRIPVYDVKPLGTVIDESIAGVRIAAWTMEVFGAVALILSAVGVYGLMAYSVNQRQREFGIRLALGAHPAAVRRMVMGQGLWMVAVGNAIGLPAALVLMRVMSGLLFGVAAGNTGLLIEASLVSALVAAAACYLPARAATLKEPIAVLRCD